MISTKQLLLLLLLFNFSSIGLFSQTVRIDNIQFYFDNSQNTIIITYDFKDYTEFETYEISLTFRDGTNLKINPHTVAGDIGKDVKGGGKKVIRWEIFNDVDELSETSLPVITISSINNIPIDPSLALIMNQINITNRSGYHFKLHRDGVMLLGVGAGVSAVYFKIKADDFIDQQDLAGNIDEYNIAGENADRYYTTSKISGAVSIICVGYALYQYIWSDKPGNTKQAMYITPSLNNGIAFAWSKNF